MWKIDVKMKIAISEGLYSFNGIQIIEDQHVLYVIYEHNHLKQRY